MSSPLADSSHKPHLLHQACTPQIARRSHTYTSLVMGDWPMTRAQQTRSLAGLGQGSFRWNDWPEAASSRGQVTLPSLLDAFSANVSCTGTVRDTLTYTALMGLVLPSQMRPDPLLACVVNDSVRGGFPTRRYVQIPQGGPQFSPQTGIIQSEVPRGTFLLLFQRP